MKPNKRKAWYLVDGVLIEGYSDKYGFHPNAGLKCGFAFTRYAKHDIGKCIFFDMNEARYVCGEDVKVAARTYSYHCNCCGTDFVENETTTEIICPTCTAERVGDDDYIIEKCES